MTLISAQNSTLTLNTPFFPSLLAASSALSSAASNPAEWEATTFGTATFAFTFGISSSLVVAGSRMTLQPMAPRS